MASEHEAVERILRGAEAYDQRRGRIEGVLTELRRQAGEADPVLALKALGRGDHLSRRYHEGTATGLNRAVSLLRAAVSEEPHTDE